mmetsp:Transcript_28283/g.32404  ORF Transcript_28283/g.32404 Transcript_28283/m.32404 type:complete len:278 (-) Transcript_28283:19-852(-)
MMGLEFDQIQLKPGKNNGVFNKVDIDQLKGKVGALLSEETKNAIKTGSLVAVLEQSLHSNDVETINWVLSNTDLHTISETVKKVSKTALHSLMQSILIKLQQGVQKSSLLWLSSVLRIRWVDVLKFINSKSSVHSKQSLSTLHTYLSRKTKNLYKFYEIRGKLQLVIDTGKAMNANNVEVDSEDEEDKLEADDGRLYRPLVTQQDESSSDSSIDEVISDLPSDHSKHSDASFDEQDLQDSESLDRNEREALGDDIDGEEEMDVDLDAADSDEGEIDA